MDKFKVALGGPPGGIAGLTNPMVVNGTWVSDDMNPNLKLSTMICKDAGPTAKCGDINNITSMLMQWTGTDMTYKISDIYGADVKGGDKPGLTLKSTADVSMLSQSASKLCSGMKEFCCEGPQPKDKSQKINCCCTPDDFMGGLYGCKGRFISPTCSESTGKGSTCSDLAGDKKTGPITSDCAIFKRAIYNFTEATQAENGARVSLYPSMVTGSDFSLKATATLADDAKTTEGTATPALLGATPSDPGTVAINVIQLFYAELCSTTIGVNRNTDQCPGCSSGGGCGPKSPQWVFGDDTSMDTDKAVVSIGDFANCNSMLNKLARYLHSMYAVVGLFMLIGGLLLLGGYFGWRHYKKKQDQLNYGAIQNDDSIYKDVTAGAADVESVVR